MKLRQLTKSVILLLTVTAAVGCGSDVRKDVADIEKENMTEIDKNTPKDNTTGYNRKFSLERITALADSEIFVFGSNLKGQHYGGAARIAVEHFGAEWGVGVGLVGQTYAIPTMHGGVDEIKPYVDEFVECAAKHPDLVFLVTPIGCGIAGFKPEQMAPLFAQTLTMENVILPRSFVDVLTKK